MKKTLLILLCIPFSILAQQYPEKISQPDMQKIMQAMQKMQICMQKIDKTEIKTMEQNARTFEHEVQSLCSKGKRAEAQKKSIKFAEKMMNHPVAIKLKKCTDLMLDLPDQTIVEDVHVCDSINKKHQ